MLRYELYKIFSRKIIPIVLLIFVSINAYNIIFRVADTTNDQYTQGYWGVYNELEGEITNEKIKYVMDGYEKNKKIIDSGVYDTDNPSDEFITKFAFGDMNMFEDFRTRMEGLYLYNDTVLALKEQAEKNIDFYSKKIILMK